MTVEVIRPFDGFQAGEIVDASGWKWTDQLIEQRYVRRVFDAPAAEKPSKRRAGNEA